MNSTANKRLKDDTRRPFWRRKSLAEMTPVEWESLCDGCARCCLEKLEDPQTGEVGYTNVGCALLDIDTCRCTDYAARARAMPDCLRLSALNIATISWLPSSCAYLLLAQGRDLADWHPLVSGEADSVHAAGMSVKGRAVAAADAGDLEDHIVTWPE